MQSSISDTAGERNFMLNTKTIDIKLLQGTG